MKIFGDRLKESREQKGLNQLELAKLLNVRNTTISAWETDVNEPDLETLVKLAKLLDVPSDYLLGIVD